MSTPWRITPSGVDRVNEMFPSQVWNLQCVYLTQTRPIYERRQLVFVISPCFLRKLALAAHVQDARMGSRSLKPDLGDWSLSSSACTTPKQLNPLLNPKNFNRNRAGNREEKVSCFSKEGGKGCQGWVGSFDSFYYLYRNTKWWEELRNKDNPPQSVHGMTTNRES